MEQAIRLLEGLPPLRAPPLHQFTFPGGAILCSARYTLFYSLQCLIQGESFRHQLLPLLLSSGRSLKAYIPGCLFTEKDKGHYPLEPESVVEEVDVIRVMAWLRQAWARVGPGLGPSWARIGLELGQDWVRVGPGLGQDWARVGSVPP